eukprot:TRINITY_DN5202_c0_g1_i3.p1 TRINITY_DN5202_c0_g1~~TRINITY_DN5202_c0_g1_i3.p1  ORF type:complete len:500 (-),score=74.00 TRINITY_DN5202_c0_g1_i3:92-1591(-)
MMFTSALKSVELNYFHCKIPISTVKRGIWLNLSIDLVSFMSLFKGQTFRSLDTIVINGPCKVRRLFTMRAPLVETLSEDGTEQQSNLLNTAFVPKTMALATGISNVNQVLNLDVVMRYIEMEKGALNPMGLQAVGRATTSNGASREGVTTKSSISSNQEEQKIGSPTPSQTEIPNKRILTKPETPNNHAQRRIASAVVSNRPFKQRNSADAEESKEEQKVAQPKFRLQMRQNTASGTKLHVPPTKPIERVKKVVIPEEKEDSSPLQVTSQQNSASKASNHQTQAKAKEIEAQGQHSPKPKSQGIRLSGLKAMPPARSNPMRISSRLGKKNLLASDEKPVDGERQHNMYDNEYKDILNQMHSQHTTNLNTLRSGYGGDDVIIYQDGQGQLEEDDDINVREDSPMNRRVVDSLEQKGHKTVAKAMISPTQTSRNSKKSERYNHSIEADQLLDSLEANVFNKGGFQHSGDSLEYQADLLMVHRFTGNQPLHHEEALNLVEDP